MSQIKESNEYSQSRSLVLYPVNLKIGENLYTREILDPIALCPRELMIFGRYNSIKESLFDRKPFLSTSQNNLTNVHFSIPDIYSLVSQSRTINTSESIVKLDPDSYEDSLTRYETEKDLTINALNALRYWDSAKGLDLGIYTLEQNIRNVERASAACVIDNDKSLIEFSRRYFGKISRSQFMIQLGDDGNYYIKDISKNCSTEIGYRRINSQETTKFDRFGIPQSLPKVDFSKIDNSNLDSIIEREKISDRSNEERNICMLRPNMLIYIRNGMQTPILFSVDEIKDKGAINLPMSEINSRFNKIFS